MTEYLIAFNGEWVPDLKDEDFREASKAVRTLRAEMTAAGVLVFLGGLGGPRVQRRCVERHAIVHRWPLRRDQGAPRRFTVVDVADEEAARAWAGKIATACGWPQEVRRFQDPNPDGPTPATA
jgi:hypothetical protein